MKPAIRDKLGILEEAWHLRRTGLLILRSRRGGLARVAVNKGGLCRGGDADRLARAVLRHELRFHAGPVDLAGDPAALGRAVLSAWRAVVAVCPAALADDMMISLVVAPERVSGIVKDELVERLALRPCAVGALVRAGAASVHELRAMMGMGVIKGPQAAQVMVQSSLTVADPWNHVPPELMARVDPPDDAGRAPVAIVFARSPAAAAVAQAQEESMLLALPEEDDDETYDSSTSQVVRIDAHWGPLSRPGAPRSTPDEATASLRPVRLVTSSREDVTEQIEAPDESWAEVDTEETLALPRVRQGVPEELTGNIVPAGDACLEDELAAQLQVDLLNRARVELREGLWSDAAETLERAEALGADDPLVLIHRAWADLWLLRDPGEVEIKVQIALEGSPDDPIIRGLAHAVRARLRSEWEPCEAEGVRPVADALEVRAG